jgi:sugar transferase (PEP-CTERM/EpsH1 system associated)
MSPPLVAHVIHRLGIGGLENGLVNLINHCPTDRYRHAIVCLTEATEFRHRLRDTSVQVIEMHKRAGQDWGLYRKLWAALRALRPSILHTRNFGALDSLLPARLAGIRHHVHGLHGWDVNDLRGTNPRYRTIRRLGDRSTDAYIAVSRDLAAWATATIGIAPNKITQIYNGVDTLRFRPRSSGDAQRMRAELGGTDPFVIGWVGRMDAVKNPLALVSMMRELLERRPDLRPRVRLAMVGAGPLQQEVAAAVQSAQLLQHVWLPGARDDIDIVLRSFDVFVLPSLNEGISNTILEAMASGIPVIAGRVGGNAELIEQGVTGTLTDSVEPSALAAAILPYLDNAGIVSARGAAGRTAVEDRFSMRNMVEEYLRVYDCVARR